MNFAATFVNKQTISMGSRVTPPEPKLGIRKQVEAIKELIQPLVNDFFENFGEAIQQTNWPIIV